MISYAMFSRTGGRERNEDSVLMCEQGFGAAFALADGLGGHGKGDAASSIVTDQAIRIFKKTGNDPDYLSHAFQSAQGRLMQKKEAMGIREEMKSTMVLLQVTGEYARWAHIGDSRLYYFKDFHIIDRTKDHSVPQMLVNAGQITENEIRRHADRNKLLRVLGTPWENSSYDVSEPVALSECQAFLLCTDGFWELIREKEMEKTLKQSRSVAQWLEKMEKIVLKRGAGSDMDNYSAICVYVDKR
ncbi:MAG: protein phosphatase 2C domain-containing protein [Eubacteriales bacterium]|nr:protein phosphatase 2C domain-containing protein [Eubacteriales bacterium]